MTQEAESHKLKRDRVKNCKHRKRPYNILKPLKSMALTEPAIRHHSDEVLWRQRLKHRDKESHQVFVLGILGFKQEVFMVEDDFTVHVFHQDPESLR